MNELFTRFWSNLLERTEGPMNLRFLLQPAMSILFATLAAIRDAKAGTAPYLWRFMKEKGQRKEIAGEAWKDVGKILIVGIVLDSIYQLIVIYKLKTAERFYPLETIVIAFALAILPYIILRGPINRIVRIFVRKNKSDDVNKI